MIGNDIQELVCVNVVNSEEKWEARKERRQPELVTRTEKKNYLKGIPKEWCEILKQQCSLCPICKGGIKNEYHMDINHKVEIYDYKKIWEHIKEYQDDIEEKQKKKNKILKVKRIKYLEYWKPKLKAVKDKINENFKRIFIKIHKPVKILGCN